MYTSIPIGCQVTARATAEKKLLAMEEDHLKLVFSHN